MNELDGFRPLTREEATSYNSATETMLQNNKHLLTFMQKKIGDVSAIFPGIFALMNATGIKEIIQVKDAVIKGITVPLDGRVKQISGKGSKNALLLFRAVTWINREWHMIDLQNTLLEAYQAVDEAEREFNRFSTRNEDAIWESHIDIETAEEFAFLLKYYRKFGNRIVLHVTEQDVPQLESLCRSDQANIRTYAGRGLANLRHRKALKRYNVIYQLVMDEITKCSVLLKAIDVDPQECFSAAPFLSGLLILHYKHVEQVKEAAEDSKTLASTDPHILDASQYICQSAKKAVVQAELYKKLYLLLSQAVRPNHPDNIALKSKMDQLPKIVDVAKRYGVMPKDEGKAPGKPVASAPVAKSRKRRDKPKPAVDGEPGAGPGAGARVAILAAAPEPDDSDDEKDVVPETAKVHWMNKRFPFEKHERVNRWMRIHPGQKYDFPGYQDITDPSELEMCRLRHAFSPVADRLISEQDFVYRQQVRKGDELRDVYHMIARFQRGKKIIDTGIISYVVVDGRCFHRYLTRVSSSDFLNEQLTTLFDRVRLPDTWDCDDHKSAAVRVAEGAGAGAGASEGTGEFRENQALDYVEISDRDNDMTIFVFKIPKK